MNDFLKYLGVVLLLLGVVCLIVYRYACPVNYQQSPALIDVCSGWI